MAQELTHSLAQLLQPLVEEFPLEDNFFLPSCCGLITFLISSAFLPLLRRMTVASSPDNVEPSCGEHLAEQMNNSFQPPARLVWQLLMKY